jgi:hypothetical protein
MRSPEIVIVGKGTDEEIQVPFAEDDELVQAFAA